MTDFPVDVSHVIHRTRIYTGPSIFTSPYLPRNSPLDCAGRTLGIAGLLRTAIPIHILPDSFRVQTEVTKSTDESHYIHQ
jgi:hypothetical protein